MKRWTMLLTLALCLLSLAALTGCGGQRDNKVGGKPAQTVAALFPESSEIWQRSGLALQIGLEKEGFLVDLRFARTAGEQTEQFQDAVGKKPVAIIIGAIDGDALKDALAEAAKQNIPVIVFGLVPP